VSSNSKPPDNKLTELIEWARRMVRSPAVAASINILGLALTIAVLVFGSGLAAGLVIGALILVAGALYLYGRIVRDSVGGLFEVAHDTREWRILSHSGERATMTLTRNARVLQDGVFALRDFAWGAKGSHVKPRCDRWPVVHEYPDHNRTVAIIALEDVKNRDDPLEFSIAWDVVDVFVDDKNWVETETLHDTVRLTMRVVFPASRAPLATYLTHSDSPDKREELQARPGKDGKTFEVTHDIWHPKRHRVYRITWQWEPDRLVEQGEELEAGVP
jgi:hypothetical protein